MTKPFEPVDDLAGADLYAARSRNLSRSMEFQQLRSDGIVRFGMPVVLESSDNTYLSYPVEGILVVIEQGTHLQLSQAIFHRMNDDHSLCAPVRVGNFRATIRGG